MHEEVSAEKKSAKFIRVNIANIHTYKLCKHTTSRS